MQELVDSFPFVHAWLVPGIPLVSAAIVLLLIRPFSAKASAWFATGAVLVATVLAWLIAVPALQYFSASILGQLASAHAPLIPTNMDWLQFQPGLVVRMGVLIDPLSSLLMLVVTTVSLLVHLYSIGYMHGEEGYGRYFGVLNLFTGAMLGLVVSTNLFQIYAFWELVGASSFLLIGFYFGRPSAVAASKKAFIVTRFADLGFFLGILLLGYLTTVVLKVNNPVEFTTLTAASTLERLAALPPLAIGIHPLTLAALLIFMGAAGKSAMFPLHVWLPDAMEGPTPVSALIHAATMVVAGVYLVARLFPVFTVAAPALAVVAGVGAFTCLFAAVIAGTQDDIKRVLAFSTLSQIGYMMLALGVAGGESAEGYTASIFHLVTHAFFKALLFLGAGSLIHAVHSNDVWKMGGLAKKMPITHVTFLLAVLAIAGIPPFAGFFSKDMILVSAYSSGNMVIFVVGLAVAGLTAFYMARIYFLAFWGKPRDAHAAEHAHESPAIMWIPLVALALLSLASGFLPFGGAAADSAHGEHAQHSVHLMVAIAGTTLGVIGIAVAGWLYGRSKSPATQSGSENWIYQTIKRKFYIDEVYLWVTHRLIFAKVAAPIAWFDRNVVDGAVNVSGNSVDRSSRGLAFLQTGQLQTYGIWFVTGASALILLLWGLR